MTVLLLVGALLVQLIVVNRLPLPFASAPDLVLLAVIGIAMARGPLAGTVLGFVGGLLVDLAPPAAHAAGQYAFVLAVAGFVAGRGVGGRAMTVTVCVVGAPLLAAGIGAVIGDPRVTAGTLAGVVPVSVAYTLLLAPAAVWLVRRTGVTGYGR
jgi:rod shape-determining protein MreD